MTTIPHKPKTDIRKQITQTADYCVKCGLCSSQCPTYRVNHTENESPRGRIALAQGLASGQLTAGKTLQTAIGHCLTCRRCEKVCPSDVKFGELIESTRYLIKEKSGKNNSFRDQTIKFTSKLTHKFWRKISLIIQILHTFGLIGLVSSRPAARWISKQYSQPRHNKPSITNAQTRRKVSLFTGCISHLLDKNTIKDCEDLLNLCGYQVNIPDEQVCCGARASHNGLLPAAKHCELTNRNAFANDSSPILFSTTGCGVSLQEYSDKAFQQRVTNITAFLLTENCIAPLQPKALHKKVLIFTACSEKNTLKQFGLVKKLLQVIPDIELANVDEKTGCCGAAGDHMLTNPIQASQYCKPLILQIQDINPDIIVSSNFPCSLHIGDELAKLKIDIPIIHPIKLLLQQLQ